MKKKGMIGQLSAIIDQLNVNISWILMLKFNETACLL